MKALVKKKKRQTTPLVSWMMDESKRKWGFNPNQEKEKEKTSIRLPRSSFCPQNANESPGLRLSKMYVQLYIFVFKWIETSEVAHAGV